MKKVLQKFNCGDVVSYNDSQNYFLLNGFVKGVEIPTFDDQYTFRIKPEEPCLIVDSTKRVASSYLCTILLIRGSIVYFFEHNSALDKCWQEIR